MLRFQKRSAQELSRRRGNADSDAVSSTVANTISNRETNAIADAKADTETNSRSSWLPKQAAKADANAKEEISAN
jgi:hypothetical protein